MKITPRYDTEPLVRLTPMVEGIATTVTRQRDRLAATLADLGADQWATPSRCEGWSVQDVIIHLASTNGFWATRSTKGSPASPAVCSASIRSCRRPSSSPRRKAQSRRHAHAFVHGNQALADALSSVDDWDVLAEAPPGHIAIGLVAIHALWDSWVHERDAAIPLGLDPVIDDAELEACLLYAGALGPSFQASTGSTRCGVIALQTTGPDVNAVIEAGPVVRDVVRIGVEDDRIAHSGDSSVQTCSSSLRARAPSHLRAPTTTAGSSRASPMSSTRPCSADQLSLPRDADETTGWWAASRRGPCPARPTRRPIRSGDVRVEVRHDRLDATPRAVVRGRLSAPGVRGR
jgi:uncharacterized protein (TIGR03083 family)